MGLFTCHMKVIIQRKQWLQFGSPTVRNFKRKLSSMNSVLPLKAEDGRSDLQEKPTTRGGIENVPFMVPVHVSLQKELTSNFCLPKTFSF